jgi:hypothetical protein
MGVFITTKITEANHFVNYHVTTAEERLASVIFDVIKTPNCMGKMNISV